MHSNQTKLYFDIWLLEPTRFARSRAGPTEGAERGKKLQGLRSEMGNKHKKRKEGLSTGLLHL